MQRKRYYVLTRRGTIGVRKNAAKEETSKNSNGEYTVKLNGKSYSVKLDGAKASVNGKTYDVEVKSGIEEKPSSSNAQGTEVKAQLPGNILRIEVSQGDMVSEGDVLLVVEAMKMETEIKSPSSGKVLSVEVNQGDTVKNGQTLVVLG